MSSSTSHFPQGGLSDSAGEPLSWHSSHPRDLNHKHGLRDNARVFTWSSCVRQCSPKYNLPNIRRCLAPSITGNIVSNIPTGCEHLLGCLLNSVLQTKLSMEPQEVNRQQSTQPVWKLTQTPGRKCTRWGQRTEQNLCKLKSETGRTWCSAPCPCCVFWNKSFKLPVPKCTHWWSGKCQEEPHSHCENEMSQHTETMRLCPGTHEPPCEYKLMGTVSWLLNQVLCEQFRSLNWISRPENLVTVSHCSSKRGQSFSGGLLSK